MSREFDLGRLILEASEHLDPHRQGGCWPDPIQWDGRPLDEQARDLCALLDARASEGDTKAAALSDRLWAAAAETDLTIIEAPGSCDPGT